jgi:urea transport system permease protein
MSREKTAAAAAAVNVSDGREEAQRALAASQGMEPESLHAPLAAEPKGARA